MKLLQSSVLISLLCFVSINSYAAAGWSGKATITSIYAMNENAAIVKLSNFSNPHGCKVNPSGDIFLNPSAQKTWFNLLLSAYMAGKSVDIYVTANCIPYWAGTDFAEIGHVRVIN